MDTVTFVDKMASEEREVRNNISDLCTALRNKKNRKSKIFLNLSSLNLKFSINRTHSSLLFTKAYHFFPVPKILTKYARNILPLDPIP